MPRAGADHETVVKLMAGRAGQRDAA
jgi:hypothetical protein